MKKVLWVFFLVFFFISPWNVWWWKLCLKFFLSCLPVFSLQFSLPLFTFSSPRLCLTVTDILCVMLSILVICVYFSLEGCYTHFLVTQESPLSTYTDATSPFVSVENAPVLFTCISHDLGFIHVVSDRLTSNSCESDAGNNY